MSRPPFSIDNQHCVTFSRSLTANPLRLNCQAGALSGHRLAPNRCCNFLKG